MSCVDGSPAPALVSGMTHQVATLRIIRDETHPQFAHLFIGRPAPSHRAGVRSWLQSPTPSSFSQSYPRFE